MTDSATTLSNFRSMIRKFNDSSFLGEILATIADAWDQSETIRLKDGVKALVAAIEELNTFGEDEAEWPEWESFLDFIHAEPCSLQVSMLQEIVILLGDTHWINGLIDLNRERTNYEKAKRELERALSIANDIVRED